MPLKPVLTLAHSPDADDVVMWWPLGDAEQGRPPAINTGKWLFQPAQIDIQEANDRAIQAADLDITAISAHAYPHVQDRYRITACGASMGEGYGPKLVCRGDDDRWQTDGAVPTLADPSAPPTIAVPGTKTTAFLVLSLLLGQRFTPRPMRFDLVAEAVRQGHADAGLLIHEAQLTFEDQGLRKLADLGHWWNRRHALPLPLGLNVVKRDLDTRFGPGSVDHLSGILAASIRHAMEHRDQSRRFLLEHPDRKPEWEDAALLDRYLRMYVSPMSLDMGTLGREALATLFREGAAAGLCPPIAAVDGVPDVAG
ncbi:MAG: ABC transporter substrate-binding protein [Phycisphaeraceae bacterium]|nr:ABC transporter substrate-binding protein [Phycisphaeraceae bacterium]